MTSFDQCFQTFPPLKPPSDLDAFWKQALNELKKIPVDPRQKIVLKKSLGLESILDVSFQSHGKTRMKGRLSIPRLRGRSPVVISFPDFGEHSETDRRLTDHGIAHLAMELRDHERFVRPDPRSPVPPPALFREYGLDVAGKSYPFACFLDAVRAVDFLRLQKGIDSNRIAILGRGLGAAMGMFAAVQRREGVLGLALERPGFAFFPQWVKDSHISFASDVRLLIEERGRTKIKKSLDYVDILHWSETITPPVLVTLVLDDQLHPPKCTFAVFNHLRCDKAMELYPDMTADPDGTQQRKKTMKFLSEVLGS